MNATLSSWPRRAALLAAGLAFALTNMPGALAQQYRYVLPAGTVIPVKLDEDLSSKNTDRGERFTATVKDTGENADLPYGTRIEGIVREATPSRNGQPGVLDVDFRRIIFPGGETQTLNASLISLDARSVKHDQNGRLIATGDKSKDRLKFIGIGAGAGLVIGALTKGNALVDALIGGGLGYLFNEFGNKPKPGDVNLKAGTEFGVQLERQVAFNDNGRYRRIRPVSDSIYDQGDRTNRDNPSYRDRYNDDPYYRDRDTTNPSYRDRYNRDDPNYDDQISDRYLRRDSRPYRDNNGDISVLIDNRIVRFGADKPLLRNGQVLIPLNPVARQAGIDYRYDSSRQTLRTNNDSLRVSVGSRYATVDGRERRLSAPIEVRSGVVYVPVEFFELATNGSATWNSSRRRVVINTER